MKEIYDRMVKEKLTFNKMASMLEPKRSGQTLRNHMKVFCKENLLEMPKQKNGRKSQPLKLIERPNYNHSPISLLEEKGFEVKRAENDFDHTYIKNGKEYVITFCTSKTIELEEKGNV